MSSATSSYTLRYFDLIGRGEPTKVLLAAANIEWTDEHPDWPAAKDEQPFGTLPVLVEKRSDGEPDLVLGESATIERYLARKSGLLPADPAAAAVQEQLRDHFWDVLAAFFVQAFCPESVKADRKAVFEALLDRHIKYQTELLQKNGNNGHLFGDSFSYADAVSYGIFKILLIGAVKFQADISDYVKSKLTPEIVKNLTTSEAHPPLAGYVAKSATVAAVVQA
ncbi:hypothetical protein IWQ57_003732 [Coemansia nantahalensis]|uniref:Uncharacterized protein n=1 Tax=Coemansia nantahalensis TaxID=2789366 RepID=A0ACC1JV10_9FUNG|nr:hypothetical protein IWQ57_003732 [Coemansia nantahalensis]